MRLSSNQKLGLFVIAMSITLFFVINFLKGSNVFSSYNIYYTYLSQVDGVTSTSPINIKGLKVGKIEKIKFVPEKDMFLVKMSVKREYDIPTDTKAEVYSSDILGSKSLRLSLGVNGDKLKNRDTILGGYLPDVLSLLKEEVAPMKEKVDLLLTNLNTTMESVNNVLDPNAQENLKTSLRRLNSTLANMEVLTQNLKATAPKLESSINHIDGLTESLNNPEGNLQKSLSNLNTTTESLASVDFAKTIGEINIILSQIKDPNTSAGKLITTDQLHNDLDNLIQRLNSLVKNIEENPKKYIRVSVF